MRVLRDVLLWCVIINFAILAAWSLLFLMPHEWVYPIWGRWFKLSAEQFDAISFAGIVLYKMGILIFNMVPYVALRIVDRPS